VEPNPRRVQCQEPYQEPNPRRVQDPDPIQEPNRRTPHHEVCDQDERAIRNIRVEASTFDGSLEPKVYVDWVGDMDYYFEWYDMSEEMKYKFAKMRLIHQARLYWANLERTRRQQDLTPITTWQEMKLKLKEKYLLNPTIRSS